ncbi:hypothetical protein JR316_0001456 [Psilocybe cubensis]|uniref:Uncharacterized protein n=2 Tax=Psilocybe cubensis TaxID=181762 RepID=A0ACB8HHQ2_PSICU|nr:hypothetical protein JR316_0001456 [Psilocybe cubensis]KAH9487381.1 hypothetical protein JR316_0001456 [Psilocybe cubensis]
MPAPYPLQDMPPGKFSNMFDYQAINMAAAHNVFIQGINAAVAHAPHITPEKVQPFMVFCLTVLDTIHHHHNVEETFYFPTLEKKLGAGSLSSNVDEHASFVPQLDATAQWCRDVQAGKEQYDANVFLEKINSFGDLMYEHLVHELPTLESSKIKAAFTEQELKAIDKDFQKIVFADIDFHTTLPMTIVCMNPATPWFPPLPAPARWAARWWFSRKHSAAWQFGPLDFSGNVRKQPGA